ALCRRTFETAYGPAHSGFNESLIPFYAAHVLQSSSARTPGHFAQLVLSGRFRQWDEGSAEGNQRRYGRPEPPDYDIGLVSAPSAIFYSDDDSAVSPTAEGILPVARRREQCRGRPVHRLKTEAGAPAHSAVCHFSGIRRGASDESAEERRVPAESARPPLQPHGLPMDPERRPDSVRPHIQITRSVLAHTTSGRERSDRFLYKTQTFDRCTFS
ncbi:Lipase, partial [Gryllus bimaculatus]